MALAPLLSEKGLTRFRTKQCERMLASKTCHFGDKCQYSHDSSWLRRNPLKVAYLPCLCPALSSPGGCSQAAICSFAHSLEEQAFHPKRYKTARCPASDQCSGYYCPLAHSTAELRAPTESEGEQITALPQVAPATVHTNSLPAGWFRIDDRLCIEGGPHPSATDTSRADGEFGSQTVPGLLSHKDGGPVIPCMVKMASASRSERDEAACVVSQLRQWMSLDSKSPDAGQTPRVLALRRTVATVCLALPQSTPSTLAGIGSRQGRSLMELSQTAWPSAIFQVSQCAQDLAKELSELHSMGFAHLCLNPASVLLARGPNGNLRFMLGDFLGKIRTLCVLARGKAGAVSQSESSFESWAMWQAPEVQMAALAEYDDRVAVDHPLADAWQLGLVIFYLCCREHPFGPVGDPHIVCRNVSNGMAVNMPRLSSSMPLVADLVQGLLAFDPTYRLSVQSVVSHPLCLSLEEASRKLIPLVTVPQAPSGLAPPPGLPVPRGSIAAASSEALRHVPILALLGPSFRPAVATFKLLQDSLKGSQDEEIPGSRAEKDHRALRQLLDAVKPGAYLRCIWTGSVRCRRTPHRTDRAERSVHCDDVVLVLEQRDSGSWIRVEGGWLPLIGIGEARNQPLFELAREPLPAVTTSQHKAADLTSSTPLLPPARTPTPDSEPLYVSPCNTLSPTSPPGLSSSPASSPAERVSGAAAVLSLLSLVQPDRPLAVSQAATAVATDPWRPAGGRTEEMSENVQKVVRYDLQQPPLLHATRDAPPAEMFPSVDHRLPQQIDQHRYAAMVAAATTAANEVLSASQSNLMQLQELRQLLPYCPPSLSPTPLPFQPQANPFLGHHAGSPMAHEHHWTNGEWQVEDKRWHANWQASCGDRWSYSEGWPAHEVSGWAQSHAVHTSGLAWEERPAMKPSVQLRASAPEWKAPLDCALKARSVSSNDGSTRAQTPVPASPSQDKETSSPASSTDPYVELQERKKSKAQSLEALAPPNWPHSDSDSLFTSHPRTLLGGSGSAGMDEEINRVYASV